MSNGIISTSIGTGFRQFLNTLIPDPARRNDQQRWGDPIVRWLRYQYLWSFYDQSIFWGYTAELLKRDFGLYKNIRPILSTIPRLIEFNTIHIMGGRLDREAGDGSGNKPSALPIFLGPKADKSVRTVIAGLWADSRWQTKKSSFARFGAAMGDVALELIDEPKAEKIRMRVVHPSEIRNVKFDGFDNPIMIEFERWELDPEAPNSDTNQMALYYERLELVDADNGKGSMVHYTTKKNGELYPWPGTRGSEWDVPLPFIPVFLNQHIDYGFNWGMSETMGMIPKSIEQDNQAASLADAAMRMANGPWLLSGASMMKSPTASNPWGAPDSFSPNTGGSESYYQVRALQISSKADMPIIETDNPEAKMVPLVFPTPVSEVVQFLGTIAESIRANFPELEVDMIGTNGTASGRALREQRSRASSKMEERRPSYEETLTRAQMGACVYGGILGYKNFEAFGEDSLWDGKADHHIGERPVFKPDPLDQIEVEQAKASAAKTYVEVGMPILDALKQVNFDEDDLERIGKNIEADKKKAAAEQAALMNPAPAPVPTDNAEATGSGIAANLSSNGKTANQVAA